MIRLLEKIAVASPVYEGYVEQQVRFAILTGGLPTDLSAGFIAFHKRLDERGVVAEIEAAARTRETDPFDTHPALRERTAALLALPEVLPLPDERPAASLVPIDVDRWLGDELLSAKAWSGVEPGVAVSRMPWSELPRAHFAPHVAKMARDLAARLHTAHPNARTVAAMLVEVLAALERGALEALARHVEPQVARVPPHVYGDAVCGVGTMVISRLFSGALLEAGAEIAPSLGEPSLVFHLDGESVIPRELATRAMSVDEAKVSLRRWAERLESLVLPL